MPQPFAWTKLQNKGVPVSARAGHTIVPTSKGFVLFGGMDGRRNDQGNPAPNNDLFLLQLGSRAVLEWSVIDLEPGSPMLPARTLHTATALRNEEMFVFGGIHSSTPYQVLSDGWILDCSVGFEWRRVQFKGISGTVHQTTMRRRNTGRITDRAPMPGSASGHNRRSQQLSASERTRQSTISFESLAAAATRAVSDRRTSVGLGSMDRRDSMREGGGGLARKTWKRIMQKKGGGPQRVSAASKDMIMKAKASRTGFMTTEEEQFHEDLISMVLSGMVDDPDQNPSYTPSQPPPRANHSISLVDNSAVLFGGHGGLRYTRRAFNDVWTFNFDNDRWMELHCRGNPPAQRSGHGSFTKDGCVFIFGGWNSETAFNDVFMLDVENKDWSDLDLAWSVPRWNMAIHLVEAIPSWRVFVFGGSCDSFNEGRSMGTYDRGVGVLDLGDDRRWDAPELEEKRIGAEIEEPLGREHTALCYDAEEGRLILFGGWANKWLDDSWQINVSSIVGPPYAINAIHPPLGPVTGGQCVKVSGLGFDSTPGAVTVRFSTAGGKYMVDVQGTAVSDKLVECVTPNVLNSIGPRECEVRLSIGVRDYTTTVANYDFFLNTMEDKSLCFGPGLLEQQQAEQLTMFLIQARNCNGENRRSGRDEWALTIIHRQQTPEGSVNMREIPYELHDLDNGRYEVRYASEPGDVVINVYLVDAVGKKRTIRGSPFRPSFTAYGKHRANEFLGSNVNAWILQTLKHLEEFFRTTEAGIQALPKLKEGDVKGLIKVMNHIKDMCTQEADLILKQDMVFETLAELEREGVPNDKQMKVLKKVGTNLEQLKLECAGTQVAIQPLVQVQSEVYRKRIEELEQDLRTYQSGLRKEAYYYYKSGLELATKTIEFVTATLDAKTHEYEDLLYIARNFDYPEDLATSAKILQQMRDDVSNVRSLWDHEVKRIRLTESFLVQKWCNVKATDMEDLVKENFKMLKEVKIDKRSDAYLGVQEVIKRWLVFCPLIVELRTPAMRDRHWSMLMEHCGKDDVTVTEDLLLRDFWNLELHKFPSEVEDVADQAKQEAKMELIIHKLEATWNDITFSFETHRNSTEVMLMHLSEEDVEVLEEDQVKVQNMFASRFLAAFEEEVVSWQKVLSSISETSTLLAEVQRTWDFLENLFIHSEEVKKELPDETDRFNDIHFDVQQVLKQGFQVKNVKEFCCTPSVFQTLEQTQAQLSLCEKALNEFMNGKRRAFPRFYFMSAADLLDVLSNGNNPGRVVPQFPKFFNAIQSFSLEYPNGSDKRPVATGMDACIGVEHVPFPEPLPLLGKVEIYLNQCIGAFRKALQHFIKYDLEKYFADGCEGDGAKRGQWVLDVQASQGVLLVQLITWVQLVETSFKAVQEGDDNDCIEKAWRQQHELLLSLIKLTMLDLSKPARQKVMCAITLDAHNRDVQERLVKEQVSSADAFQWQSMLKGYWEAGDARLQICDAAFMYAYEYLGNGPRLVVTPLTDRIYVTATQALHLCMGCAPAGPAGTGKTESTKDLANALARACYVINAAPEMDYITMGNIFKGLAASGSWGCFDEFNRLVPEVLSVCTVQFKAVCDALRLKAKRFILQGDEINLDPNMGAFITMNPGYLGRSELPEGLKSLFRPITVMVPDFRLIMENMFMSEGFLEAKTLALKFSTLYALNKDLLSKSNKYDWGMRAIKSVLVVAGGFKRAEPELPESAVLMRSLRDTNVAKIEGDDLKIFMGLLSDLFPGIDVPRARDYDFESLVVRVMEEEFGYTNDEGGYLMLKITQFIELLNIRHSLFLMGNPGSFKSTLWKVLRVAKSNSGEKTTVVDFSPKAISTNELYGCVNMATREWKDGILSKTMRDLGTIPDTLPKWIVLDGDLDANWIESMNSVMDDSRLLTLPSNERIPLKAHMKMIFEIRDLNYATPATATRAGIVCMSDTEGVQWKSYVASWIKKLSQPDQVKENLVKLFEKYCGDTLQWLFKTAKFHVPLVTVSLISSLCSLLESVLGQNQALEALHYWFVFCTINALGSCLSEVDGVDFRKQFSNWWKNEMKTIKFPAKGLVFDYYVKEARLEEWSSTVEEIAYNSTTPMGDITVPTAETMAIGYFMKALIQMHHPVMLIGLAGCGKTQACQGLLRKLSPTDFMSCKINMNYYMESSMLQAAMELPLEKKAGRLYAPPGNLQLVYFIDDLNMPALDKYNTQSGIELLKQKQDYGHWYDRAKIMIKDIGHTQYLCCMNPTAGSFIVNPRLQRHFWTCSVPFPEQSALLTIYSTFMRGHFERLPFKAPVQDSLNGVIKATLSLHNTVVQLFRKTARNMHYEFTIRHLSGVFAGMLQALPTEFTDAEKFVSLWLHESERIYGDRLVDAQSLRKYRNAVSELVKKMFSKHNLQRYLQEKSPELLVMAPFARGLQEMVEGVCYDKIKDVDRLWEILSESLKDYNENNPAMDLVLFEDAMKHVAKISRIICNPSGHPLLVGVGGSGRQSLARLSAYICQLVTMTIVIGGSYGLNELKGDLQAMYKKAGERDEGVHFLFTDNQISNERFLVFFNDLLASGEVTDLFPAEDKDQIRNVVRSACRASGVVDTPENLWNYYIGRVRKNLHMSLCFSPVGDALWGRARKFPAIVNCTVIDWFQPWPSDALHNVATKFLKNLVQLGPPDHPDRPAIIEFFPFSFEAVNQVSQTYIDHERRYAYSTPKSFLELIRLYSIILAKKMDTLEGQKIRLTNGLVKLRDTQEQVAGLEEELKDKAVVVKEKAEKADVFAEEVGREKAKVNAEAEKANVEAVKCQQIAEQVSVKKDECEKDLVAAIPLVEQAEAALDVLDKKDFIELKAFKTPHSSVEATCEAAMQLMAGIDPTIDVDRKGKIKDKSWKSSQKMMNDPGKFLDRLKALREVIDASQVPPHNVEEARRIKDSMGADFKQEAMRKKSQAAGGLCEWIINIIKYYDVVVQVEPKKKSLKEAEDQLQEAYDRQKGAQMLVSELEERLRSLISEYDKAIAEKHAVMAEAERCQTKLDMAQRLVGALSANGVIWEQTVETAGEEIAVIPGDTLIACAFAAYSGVFTREYRDVVTTKLMAFLKERAVALSEEPDPLMVLSTEAEQARWCSKGLPTDRVSLENGAIMTNSERWCLIIDPQTQGIVWVKNQEAVNKLMITRMGHAKMLQTFEQAIDAGRSVLIENMGESIDAVLMPVIARNTLKRGGKRVLKLGDKEIKYNDKFRLFMQTKLSNPHYPPEIQAECTVINFTVTEQGLEEQLLFLVIKLERPDLARLKAELIQQQNEFKVRLADLEALLLEKLAAAEGDIVDDIDLIHGLEDAKATSDETKERVLAAQENEAKINETSENYRPVADRGALLFFLMMDLGKMHTFYKYSLESFVMVVTRAVNSVSLRQPKEAKTLRLDMEEMGPDRVPSALSGHTQRSMSHGPSSGDIAVPEAERRSSRISGTLGGDVADAAAVDMEELEEEEDEEEELVFDLQGKELTQRTELLTNIITLAVFSHLRRGLLDADKLTVASMLTLRILVRSGKVTAQEVSMLIRAPLDPHAPPMPESVKSWLTEQQWAQLKGLEHLPIFKSPSGGPGALTNNMEQDILGWKRWLGEERAESVDLPRSVRTLQQFHRIFLLRVLRPDRIGAALTQFVVDNLGQEFIDKPPFDLQQTYDESTSHTPLFFVLFPGTDPTPTVESFARKLGFTEANGKFVNISMGQGQEQSAVNVTNEIAREGGWVMLQNIHLMQAWLKTLERTLELIEEFAHHDFRCVLTSEPPGPLQGPLWDLLPEAILQKCIKVADEAPTDLKSNLRRAYSKFSQEHIEKCTKPREFKATLFALCFFHALMSGRIKFGPQGWSKKYPFNDGDLTICAQVLCNYLNTAEHLGKEVPWPDIRYIFGEIMYGGHITDQWDRRVCNTYLSTLVLPDLLHNMALCPGFKSPDASKFEYVQYSKFVEEKFPPEQPQMYSLHGNAEIGFLTNQGMALFNTVQNISGSSTGSANRDISESMPIIQKCLEELPPDLDMAEIRGRLKPEDYTPYLITSLQESDRMNLLLQEIRRSLTELELGISGQLNVTDRMEALSEALQENRVNGTWAALAFPSLKPLAAWLADLGLRVLQLVDWTAARELPKSLWISGLFNPMAFLTAVMQVTARASGLALDYMTNRAMWLNTRDPAELARPPTHGVYIHGLFLEGASWEEGKGDDEGYIADSRAKELRPEMQVAHVFSVQLSQMDWTSMYHCPVFVTALRGSTFVVEVNVRMDPDDDERRWILAGTALLLTNDGLT